jgi:hypothetical protein
MSQKPNWTHVVAWMREHYGLTITDSEAHTIAQQVDRDREAREIPPEEGVEE